MKKHTKIVATISDRKCDVEFIRSLYEGGMNVVRINTAHQTPKDTLMVINNVRSVSDRIPILLDTKGPEIRTTKVEKEFDVEAGYIIKVKGEPELFSNPDYLYVSYENFANDLSINDSILIDDGDIELVVKDKNEDHLICEVQNSGTIKSRKSINVPGVHINLPALSDKDRVFIQFAIENNIEFIAHSFVRNKEDVITIQDILDEKQSPIKIIAKIENSFGVDNIDEILDHAYGVMVARGDLGIEIPGEKIPGIQKTLIKKCKARKKPVIIATQMLHSMIDNPRPTRAEVSDIANAIYHETDAIMLSGETANGKYPLEAVEVMTSIAKEVENSKEVRDSIENIAIDNHIGLFLAEAAVKASNELSTKCIVLDTLTGRTARYIAAFRGQVPVYAICYNDRVMKELALSYGIYAEHLSQRKSTDEFKEQALHLLLDKDLIEKKDEIVILGGSFGASCGVTFIDISTVSNMIHE